MGKKKKNVSPLHSLAQGQMEYHRKQREQRNNARATSTDESRSMGNQIQPEEAGPNGMAPDQGEHPEALSHAVASKNLSSAHGFSPFVRHLQARGLAVSHPDLVQCETEFGPGVRHGSDAQAFVGQSGFGGWLAGTDTPEGADCGRPFVETFDARSNAGRYASGRGTDAFRPHFLDHLNNADQTHGNHESARLSASPPNGSHNDHARVTSNVVSGKMSRMDVIKQAMREQGII